MKKIDKQLFIRMLWPLLLMFTGIAVVIFMAVTQPEEGHPAYANILGIAGTLIPFALAIFLLARLLGKSMVVSMVSKELKELKHCKDFYYGSITADTPQKYLNTIVSDLGKARYKDYTAEVNLQYDNYRFLLRKHFWTLDSTNNHVHLAIVNADALKIKEFFNDVINKEVTLNYGKYKGSYCSIVAVCAVDGFNENEQFFAFFDEEFFVRGIAVIKVVIDVSKNRVFISRGGAATGNRGKRIIKKFVLRTKSLRKCLGEHGRNNELIKELEETLNEMDLNILFRDVELTEQQMAFAYSLRDGEVAFQGKESEEEGGIIFYKEDNKILYLFCDYDGNDKTFGISGEKDMKWRIPNKARIPKKHKLEIMEKIIKYLKDNSIPHAFLELVYSKENQTVLFGRVQK